VDESTNSTTDHIQTHIAVAGGAGKYQGSHVASCLTFTSPGRVPTGFEHDVC